MELREIITLRPLVMQRNGGWNFFYTHDGNKNVSDVVSFQQARGVPAHYEYAPFGAVTVSATNTAFTAFNVAATNPFRFSSEYADDALGLVYCDYGLQFCCRSNNLYVFAHGNGTYPKFSC